ncbi:MAG: DUF4395 domain-containing protein [Actinobacteria bacterium]|jgi:hypothetical protein|nr:DUF4395 domain-containing protein [Actinomycetota bacterium]
MTTLEKNQTPVVIDARGPRFSAAITVFVLATALVTQSLPLITFQLVVFLIGATKGPQFTPYAFLFKSLIKPRLKSEFVPEDVRPPRFAQAVGLIFATIAVAGLLSGATIVFTVATGFALAAAFLNAAFNYCLGCEVYLLLLRARR